VKKRAISRNDFEWLMEAVGGRARKYPSEAFDELFRSMDEIERRFGLQYRPTKSERAAIDEGLRDVRSGRLATEKEVTEMFRRFRRPRRNKDDASHT
jgi:hypothetical protein